MFYVYCLLLFVCFVFGRLLVCVDVFHMCVRFLLLLLASYVLFDRLFIYLFLFKHFLFLCAFALQMDEREW